MKKLFFNWEVALFSALLFVAMGLTQMSTGKILDIRLPTNPFTGSQVTPTPTGTSTTPTPSLPTPSPT